ncbi:recombinase RecT [Clostridioides difficile]|nr:recombinase RecT [Clostridioides difficile]
MQGSKLNPFIKEAYLIKFGNSPANIVVGKDVFVKEQIKILILKV